MVFILKFKNDEMEDTYYLENNNFDGDFYGLAFDIASNQEESNPILAGANIVNTLCDEYGFVETKAQAINFTEDFF